MEVSFDNSLYPLMKEPRPLFIELPRRDVLGN
jgi:hypothetical protein